MELRTLFPTSLCWVLVFGCALPPACCRLPLPARRRSSHTTCSHTTCSHTTCSHTHNLLTTQLAHHTTCSHTTCSHTTYSPHNLLTTQLAHTQLAPTHTTYSHTHTTCSHTQHVHTQLLTHNLLTHNLLTHNLLTTQLTHHTTCSHTTCSPHNLLTHNLLTHTTYSPHNLLTTQLAHTQLAHTQLTHTQLAHTQLTHTQLVHAQLTHTVAGVALTALGWLWWRSWVWVDAVGAAAVCVAGVALGGMDRHFAWQAWHLATWTVTLPGRRGTWRHGPSLCVAGVALTALGWLWWRAWVWVDAVGAAAVCVAGVARGDMDCLAWQEWHLATWTCTLRGRRGTWGHASSLFVASVALGDMDCYFAWQVWHLWHWAGSGGALGSELMPWAPRPFHCCTRRSFTISFLFPAFPIPSFYFSFAAYWKKLTCGVIRSFSCCFCCSFLRAIDTGGKRLITTYDHISPWFPVPFLSLVADCIWLFRLVDLRHISLDQISGI